MLTDYDNIVFDLGGVVIDLHRQDCIDAFGKLGFREAAEELGQYVQRGVFYGLETGKITAAEFFRDVAAKCRPGVTAVQIQDAFNAFLTGLPVERLRALRDLRRHARVFALSNTNPVMYDSWIAEHFRAEGLTVNDYFDGIVTSFQEGCCKPDHQIFKSLVRRYGLNPSRTLYLDDSEDNCRAAEACGLRSRRVTPENDMLSVVRGMNYEKVPTGVAVGNFDGVHSGHRRVLQKLRSVCADKGLRPLVITFTSHPLELIAPERAPKLLQTTREKADALRDLGFDVELLDFNEELRALTTVEFLKFIREKYDVRFLVLGYDNKFGSDGFREGLPHYLRAGKEAGVAVELCDSLPGVSSTSIRRLISSGDISTANGWLARRYSLEGTVVHGDALGREIGFPTANISPADCRHMVPGAGVYAAVAVLDDGSRCPAVVNIGCRPTVADCGELRIEAHLPGFEGDLYGRKMLLEFVARIRDEKKFDSLEALRQGIEADIRTLGNILSCGEGSGKDGVE